MPDVGNRRRPVALTSGGAEADRLRATAFALLLGTGRAIEVAEIAAAADLDDIGPSLEALADRGQVDRDPQGRVTGAAGLSLDHGPHLLNIAGRGFRTWCAFDAVGIAAALTADASIETRCGWCGSAIPISFRSGIVEGPNAPRLWLAAGGVDLRADFCEPTVLLCSADHAHRWGAAHGGHGKVLTMEAAASLGAVEWQGCAETATRLGAWEAGAG